MIDFLSGSSTSSLAINEKGEKIVLRQPPQQQQANAHHPHKKSHRRNNSTTSLPQADTRGKSNAEGLSVHGANSSGAVNGKLKLCHKKSASFSGKTSDLTGETSSNKETTSDTVATESKDQKDAILTATTPVTTTTSTTSATDLRQAQTEDLKTSPVIAKEEKSVNSKYL